MSQFNLYLEKVQESRNYQYQEMNSNSYEEFKNRYKTPEQKSNEDIQTLANLIGSVGFILAFPFLVLFSTMPGKKGNTALGFSDLYNRGKIVETAIDASNLKDTEKTTYIKEFNEKIKELQRMEKQDAKTMVQEIDDEIGKTIVGGLKEENIKELVNVEVNKPGFFTKIYNKFFNK